MPQRRIKLIAWLATLTLVVLACGTGGSDSSDAADDNGDSTNLAATQDSLEATQDALEAAQAQVETAEAEAEADTEQESEPTTDTAEDSGDATEPQVEEPPDLFVEEWESINHLDWWDYHLTSGNDDEWELFVDDSKLTFEMNGENIYAYLFYAEWYYQDIRVDVEVRNVGANNNNVSLVCRENERGWYEFNIANNGLYSILKYEYDSNEYSLLYNGGAEEIRTGKDTNWYTAICQGDTLTLGVNGTEVRTITDTTFIEGYAGISVSSFQTLPVIVEVNWVEFSAP